LRTFTEANDWSGLLVEAVPYVFARLQRERGHDPRLRLENANSTARIAKSPAS
jgi:hypothetical protein